MRSIKFCALYLYAILALRTSIAEDNVRINRLRDKREPVVNDIPHKPSILVDTTVEKERSLFSFSQETDTDFGISRRERVIGNELDQLGDLLSAGIWAEANAQNMPYAMSTSTQDTANYEIKLVFQHECDTADRLPNIADKIESALIRYHEYVSDKEIQGLRDIGVAILQNETSTCIPGNRRNLGTGRKLLRGLQRSRVVYNLFVFCFGPCPSQALPSVPTSNRRLFLEEIEFLSDIVPFLDQFKQIFKEEVNLTVTNATTVKEDTKRIDCSQSDQCYNDDGRCCGQNDCTCKTVSESVCRVNGCDLTGGECCDKFLSCSELPSCSCLSLECSNRDFCCEENDFRVCDGICPLPPTA